MAELSPALVRTLVPIVIGPLVARFFPGVNVEDPNTLLLVSGAVSYLYYVLIRLCETKYPKLGYLLGIAKAPAYASGPGPSPGTGEHATVFITPDIPPVGGDGEGPAD